MKQRGVICIAMILILSFLHPFYTGAAVKPVFTISPNSKPINKAMMKYSTYNTNTKHYYLLRSYLEQLEKKGGGALVLQKGTYSITNTLFVPSNVTIRLTDGVKLIKGSKTGTSKFQAAKSMFQLIRPSRAFKNGVYGKYNGEKNINFIGEGTAFLDMKYDKDGIAIIMGHNQNVKVENIQFTHMYSGHFIELDASNHVVIRNNQFIDSQASVNKNKEAINIDTPDRTTKGWSQNWSTYDKTPNDNVTIVNNVFKNLDRAVGTHKYSEDQYHNHVNIIHNTIDETRLDAIRVMNWKNAVIENNIIKNVNHGDAGMRGILASGALYPTFKNNSFENVGRVIQFIAWKNEGPGSQYQVIYNVLTSSNKADLMQNRARNTAETIIRINHQYNEYIKNTEKISLIGY